jgi:hypothetical protein
MKAIAILIVLALGAFHFTPGAAAQNDNDYDRGSISVFADYFRHGRLDNNMIGVGFRLGVGAHPNVHLEGEFGYHWAQVFSEGFEDTITGDVTFADSNVRILHGLFGPKFQTTGAARVFAVLKAGFINFRFDDPAVTPGNIISQFGDLRSENTRLALYPGVGFDASAGPIGIRFDIGDEIYWLNGARHNLRLTVGPQIRW